MSCGKQKQFRNSLKIVFLKDNKLNQELCYVCKELKKKKIELKITTFQRVLIKFKQYKYIYFKLLKKQVSKAPFYLQESIESGEKCLPTIHRIHL